MQEKQRYTRIRKVILKLNHERKKQAQQMDILCNDIIAAQRDFIKKLERISFIANFYSDILGKKDLSGLCCAAGKLLTEQVPGAVIALIICRGNDFEMHLFENEGMNEQGGFQLEECLDNNLVNNISQSGKICDIDDMVSMGLSCNPAKLNSICAKTIPLGRNGTDIGFILIYRHSGNKLSEDEIQNIAAITPGLSQAIQSNLTVLHPTD